MQLSKTQIAQSEEHFQVELNAWSKALRRRGFTPVHDRGRVLVDTAVCIADGGRVLSDLAALRDQGELHGSVASDSTLWRAFGGDRSRPAGPDRHRARAAGALLGRFDLDERARTAITKVPDQVWEQVSGRDGEPRPRRCRGGRADRAAVRLGRWRRAGQLAAGHADHLPPRAPLLGRAAERAGGRRFALPAVRDPHPARDCSRSSKPVPRAPA